MEVVWLGLGFILFWVVPICIAGGWIKLQETKFFRYYPKQVIWRGIMWATLWFIAGIVAFVLEIWVFILLFSNISP